MSAYIPLVILIIAAGVIGIMFANLSRLLGPFRPNQNKLRPYESGMDPVGSAHERFSVKFYLVAMLFILFDIEVVFMYPWAVQYKELLNGSILGSDGPTLFPLIEMFVFVGILFVGYVYVYKKGGLSWT
jgi:NADH-quinone oxidoreductase subunit A